MSEQFNKALGRVARQPTFVAAVVVLLVAAVGLNASVRFMKLHFKKEPVQLQRPLTQVAERVGSWVQVMPDRAIDREMQDVLGTEQYIFREYVDERLAGNDVQERFRRVQEQISAETRPDARAKLEQQQDQMLVQIRSTKPEAVVSLSVTYYTGMVDTVAHVPDRCYVANGFEPSEYKVENWPIAKEMPESARPVVDGKPSDNIEVRFINFEDQTGLSKVKRSVVYFFQTNGTFESSPLGVRRRLQSLFERHAYYAKVEVMTLLPDPSKSAAVMTDFLTSAMPEIHRALPDWNKVTAGEKQ